MHPALVLSTVDVRIRERYGGFEREKTFCAVIVNVQVWVGSCWKLTGHVDPN